MTEAIQNIDFAVLDFIQRFMRSNFLDAFMFIISDIGVWLVWIGAGLALICIKKYRLNGIAVISAFAAAMLLTEFIIKPMFMRERPYQINAEFILAVSEPIGSSFPSSHTSVSFASAVSLFSVNKLYGIIGLIFAAIVMFSRLYLYVHFPSDVFAGMCIGIIVGIVAITVSRRIITKRTKNNIH